MKIFNHSQLEMTVRVAGFGNDDTRFSVVDRAYAMPTRQFIEGAFSWALASFLGFFRILKWAEQANDCDDFARISAAFAQILHFLTPGRPPATALAVGELWYVLDSGGGHAINICLCGESLQDVLTYEPQTRRIITLSEPEKLSATVIRF